MRAKNKAMYGTRRRKKQQQGHGIQKQKQSKSTIHFIKSPEIVFELISNSQRMFKRYFNENYLNYSAPTSFMSFPFYANICCAMRWNVGAACFFFVCTHKAESRRKKGKSTGKWARIYEARPSKSKYHTDIHIHMYGPIRESTQNKNMVKRTARRQRQRHCWYETTSCDLICARIRAKHIVCSAAHQTITTKNIALRIFFCTWANSFNGSKCYNGKLLAKHQCHPWNMKWLFRTCTNFESHFISPPRSRVEMLCARCVCVCLCVCTDGQYDMRFVCVFLARFFKWTFVVFSFLFFFSLLVVWCPFYDGSCFWVAKNGTQNGFILDFRIIATKPEKKAKNKNNTKWEKSHHQKSCTQWTGTKGIKKVECHHMHVV